MGRRTVLLIAALLAAVLGVVLVFLYAQNIQNQADADAAPVTVLVAKAEIPAGTTGAAAANAGSFEQQVIPAKAAAPTALSDPAAIQDLVALGNIFPGQQIISQQWGTEGQLTRLPLPDGKIALSLELGDPQRVAGFVSPGSTVAIFATGGPRIRTLLSGITVIGVGATGLNAAPTQNGEQQTSSAILTLAVTQAEAEKIIYSQGLAAESAYNGLYFALMDENSDVQAGDPGVDDTNLFR
ncbi:MAG: Flp pilus assembly protein CpaB [Candidatus Nanopelagicales bacterium]